jgi:membrane associated rhomboid family serine protease
MLLPYASDRPPRNPPMIVVSLVLLHFLLFGLIALLRFGRNEQTVIVWYANFSLVPAMLRWYTPFTYGFLHEDVFHLSVNMLFLWVFGGSVEDAIGGRRFLLLYVVAVLVTGPLQAAMTFLLPDPDMVLRTTPIIGASGAVSAIVGVFAVRFYRSRIRFIGLPFRIPAVLLLAFVLLGEMGYTVWQLVESGGVPKAQAVAHWAHIGGFIFGMVWAQGMRLVRAGKQEYAASDAAREMEEGSPFVAVERWQRVLKTQPDNMEAEAALGRAYALSDHREESLTHYRRAISGLIRQGERRSAARHYQAMVGYYAGVILEAADLLALASALEEQGDYDAALTALETMLRAHPDAPEAEVGRLRAGVLALKRLDAPERAERHLEKFLAAYPHSEFRAYADDLLRTARTRKSS